jgi:hypothetical protein
VQGKALGGEFPRIKDSPLARAEGQIPILTEPPS